MHVITHSCMYDNTCIIFKSPHNMLIYHFSPYSNRIIADTTGKADWLFYVKNRSVAAVYPVKQHTCMFTKQKAVCHPVFPVRISIAFFRYVPEYYRYITNLSRKKDISFTQLPGSLRHIPKDSEWIERYIYRK